MTISYANVNGSQMELTPMRVSYKAPGASTYADLGGTLSNVLVKMEYGKANIYADQLGKTIIDRRVSSTVCQVTTELSEIKNKDLFKIAFPHATFVQKTLTAGTATAANPSVFTFTAHGLANGSKIQFTAGTLPTGFSLNTSYYVVVAATDTFELSLTQGGSAIAGTGSAGTGLTLVAHGEFNTAFDFLSAIGDGDLVNSGSLLLHPLSKADADLSGDYLFYKACSTASSEVTYGPEGQAKIKVVWEVLPDTSVTPARFFRHGDPAVV